MRSATGRSSSTSAIAPQPAVSIGGGAHGVAFTLSGADLVTALSATAEPSGVQVADVTELL